MLEAWLEEEDNRNRLIEKIGLRRDIDEINDKMSEILNSMEVCGRKEVSRVIDESVERAISNTLESQQMEYVVSRAVNQLTQDATHLDHMGNAILTKSSILEGIGQAVSKKISEAISEILDGDSEIAAMASAIARDCLLYTSPSPRDQRGSRMPSSA